MVLLTNLTNTQLQEDTHVEQHNEANTAILALEDKALGPGKTRPLFQTIYNNAQVPADNEVLVTATGGPLHLLDSATPSGVSFFRVGPTGGPLFDAALNTVLIGAGSADTVTIAGKCTINRGGSADLEIGSDAQASGTDASALGKDTRGTGARSLAAGLRAECLSDDTLALGVDTEANGARSMAMGHTARTNGADAVAIGGDAQATNATATALGSATRATGQDTTAVGTGAQASALNAQAFGNGSNVAATSGLGLGKDVSLTAAATAGVGIGESATVTGLNAIALGYLSDANGQFGVALGTSSAASASCVALGYLAAAGTATGGVALGTSSDVTGQDGVGLGANTTASASRATAIGEGATASNADEVVIGTSSDNVVVPGTFAVTDNATFSGRVTADDIISNGPIGIAAAAGSAVSTWENTTGSDADGSRQTAYSGLGKTAGGTRHALGALYMEHEGTASDQKSRIRFATNAGSDGFAPSTNALILLPDGDVKVGKDCVVTEELDVGGSNSWRTDSSGLTADRTVTLPDADVHLGDTTLMHGWGGANLAASTTKNLTTHGGVTELPVGYEGEIVGITAVTPNTVPAGGTVDFEVRKNGTLQGSPLQLNNSNRSNRDTSYSISLAAGDLVQVEARSNGTWTGGEDVAVYLYIRQRVKS